jgi:adenosine deaminase
MNTVTNTSAAIHDLVRRLPKAELHLHLEGAVSLETLIALAAKHSVELPEDINPSVRFEFKDLDDFIRVASLTFSVMLDKDDFALTTYQMLSQAAEHGARHVEFFFSPSSHPSLSYKEMLDGIQSGMQRAQSEYGVTSFVIPSHNRMLGERAGFDFLQEVNAYRIPQVVGVGLEFAERPFPPDVYKALYEEAKLSGLKLTAHAGEDGPSEYVSSCLKLLHCDRIDHGYHIIDDDALVEHCRQAGVWFTCCPTTTRHTTKWHDPTNNSHAIQKMLKAGLNLTINTDDPGFFQTDLTAEYMALGLSFPILADLALNSLQASWLNDDLKASMRPEWQRTVDELLEQYKKL